MIRSIATMLIAVPLFFCVAAAQAKTAEEQVAFIIFGLEDGAEDAAATAALVSTSPAVFELTEKKGGRIELVTFHGEREGPCIYTMHFSKPDAPDIRKLETQLDFSRVTGIRLIEDNGGVRREFDVADGFCVELPDGQACAPDSNNAFARASDPLPATATAERMNAAFAEFRKTVCPAAAQ